MYEELYHHGIKGQRWGVRRFQDAAGALTEAGRQRYGYAKKAAKFGVALTKAKAEHYGVQAKNKAKDLEISAKNLAVKARRAYDPHYYEHRSNQAIIDYKLRKTLNQNHISLAKVRESEAKRDGVAMIEQYQDALVSEIGAKYGYGSQSRQVYRNFDYGQMRGLRDIGDVSKMTISELQGSTGSPSASIADYGRRYLEAEDRKQALESTTWQDYFEPASPLEYSQSYESRQRLGQSHWSKWYD